jgi:outer membrane protein assembly factor BamB
MRRSSEVNCKPRGRVLALCLALVGLPVLAQAEAEGWLMRGADTRRTGRAHVNGPIGSAVAWTYLADSELAINMEPTVSGDRVFFGTWGAIRKHGESQAQWDRFDGALHAVDRSTGQAKWGPLRPGVTPYAYAFAGRETSYQDRSAGKGLHLSFYNGTFEGSGAVDPKNGRLYFGRGDGQLYAVDAEAGSVEWAFRSLDPARPDDPEGGGQIVGGPLVTPGGAVVFATYGAPAAPNPPALVRSQTNAVYGVENDGTLRWRRPAKGGYPNPFVAAPALSRSGDRLYAITQRIDAKHPAHLLAMDSETGTLLWEMTLDDRGGHDLAVGIDGTIYVAGIAGGEFARKPAAFAVADRGDRGEMLWTTLFRHAQPQAHWAGGLALYENDTAVRHVYVSTTNAREANARAGRLYGLDPSSGEIRASFDPSESTPRGSGGLTDVTLGNDGTVYVGASGYNGGLLTRGVEGRMYALLPKDGGFEVIWSLAVGNNIAWSSPAIGPEGGLFFGSAAQLSRNDPLRPHLGSGLIKHANPIFYAVKDPN